MFGVKNITYTRGNDTLSIDIEKNNFSYTNVTQDISKDTSFRYLERFFRTVDSWEEEYLNSNLIDGDSWCLIINHIDGRVKKYSGHAEFPYNFEAFERLNQDLVRGLI